MLWQAPLVLSRARFARLAAAAAVSPLPRARLPPALHARTGRVTACTAALAGQPHSIMSLDKRIGFMGSGQMAEALARGLLDRGVVRADQICCSDPAPARKELFASLGATPYDTNLEVGCSLRCCHSMHLQLPCHAVYQKSLVACNSFNSG
jgi:NADP oxidoreductase coenzyme F420-dependent